MATNYLLLVVMAAGISRGLCCFGGEQANVVEPAPDATVVPTVDPKDEQQKLIDQIPCNFVTCSFEGGSLCLYESSGSPALPKHLDEKTANNPVFTEFLRGQQPVDPVGGHGGPVQLPLPRQKRQDDNLYGDYPEAQVNNGDGNGAGAGDYGGNGGVAPVGAHKSWLAWSGRFGNRVTGINRPAVGNWYAGAYLEAFESAVMDTEVLYQQPISVTFYGYEATEDVQMRMCCDSVDRCALESPIKSHANSRRWLKHTVSCPAGTKKLVFICKNTGNLQGACALDGVQVEGDDCPSLQGKWQTPQALIEEQRRRLFRLRIQSRK